MQKLQESGENYLETVLILQSKGKNVRSIDIANELGYSKPSVSRAVGILKSNGYIIVDEGGYITLTQQGKALAETMYERHRLLSRFFMELGVQEETAVADACRIEHIISQETFDRIKLHFWQIESTDR